MTTAPPTSFRYEEKGGVAAIRFDRPDRLNALTFQVYRELTALFVHLRGRDDVRAVHLSGEGRAFCTGGDVKDIIGPLLGRDAQALYEFTRLTCDLIGAIRGLPKPVVAALQGPVSGAGAVIALASDFRIGAEDARFAFLFVKVGLSGSDMGAGWLLPRVIGHARATEMLMLGDFVDAPTAERWGLLHRVVPRDQLDAESRALAERLAAGPAMALAMTKKMLDQEAHMDLTSALEAEAQAQALCMGHSDFRAAYEAFLGKKAPVFK
jgi:enoyl-CoA hydratase/carnithine racemase